MPSGKSSHSRGIGPLFLVLGAFGIGCALPERDDAAAARSTPTPASAAAPALVQSTAQPAKGPAQAFIFGRVTTDDGAVYEGRLRFGGAEEAFWGDYFNGHKSMSPWASHKPGEPRNERRRVEIFGIQLPPWDDDELSRPFMVRFGDIARIDADGRDLRVTLRSGTVVHLDRYAADDFADGVRVWDRARGEVDLDEWGIRTIEFLPTGQLDAVPERLYGTVRTPGGDFTGFLQWDREEGVASDELNGLTASNEEVAVRFDRIRSITRVSGSSSRVALHDGRELLLSGRRNVGEGNRGVYVDDPRYGRVLVSWQAFQRVDFNQGGEAPGYEDFPVGGPLSGGVTTRAGSRIAGRIVFDLDESERIETLDVPSDGVDYTILFGLVDAIELPPPGGAARAMVTLHSGERLQPELAGDLNRSNAGVLVFAEGRDTPEYVSWADVARIDFERPPAMYPPIPTR